MRPTSDWLAAAYEGACRAEIEALKPGNVHVFADGHAMTTGQFLESARVSAGPLTDTKLPVGRRILDAVRATRGAVGVNTNLGILLLCAPIVAAAQADGPGLRHSLRRVLDGLTMDDAGAVFEAIVLASPGGLGSGGEHDVREPPKVDLLTAMRAAADRDMIARQYVTSFKDVFDTGLPALRSSRAKGEVGMWPTIRAYMAFLSAFPDSHIARKHGEAAAERVRKEALEVRIALDGEPDEAGRIGLLLAFDRRLKAEGFNPGTSADLTVACLLVDMAGDRLASSVG